MTEQRRLAAIVCADVAGYSRLMGRDVTLDSAPVRPPISSSSTEPLCPNGT